MYEYVNDDDLQMTHVINAISNTTALTGDLKYNVYYSYSC